MRRVVFRGELRLEEAQRPVPGEGELLVQVDAVGVTLPVIRSLTDEGTVPGGEVVGRIAAIGPDVTGWEVGQRAAGLAFTGAYAEFAAVKAPFLAPLPDDVDDLAALTLVRSGQVALGALRAGALQPGENVLVTSAASGVGHLAVQLAQILGAKRVVAAVGSLTKADFLRDLGADEVVSYGQITGPLDVALDGTGGEVQKAALEALDPFGRLVSYNANGDTVDVNQLRFHSKSVIGFAMAHLASRRPEIYDRHRRELWEFCADGRLRPAIHAVLPLSDATEAHRIIQARENLGKVVLRTA